jgi:pimeloyl-ACP methyl ester carboxylesterase
VLPLVLLHGLFGRAANFGAVQARLAASRRVLALDLRNHGASPHDPHMDYPSMAQDVADTLRARGAWPCAALGHSMGGKVAMWLALHDPGVARLVVADIAPVRYPPHFRDLAAAMLGIDLRHPLSRAAADAALAPAAPDRALRGFLLQNFRPGAAPGWSCGLAEIAAALPAIESFPGTDRRYAGPALVLSGARSDYVRAEHADSFRVLFPRVRFARLHRAGHWLHADDPDGFVAVVDAFVGATAREGET